MNNLTISIKKMMLDAGISQSDIGRNLGVSVQRVNQVINFSRVAGEGVGYIRNGIFHILKSRLPEKCPSYDELWGIEKLSEASNA